MVVQAIRSAVFYALFLGQTVVLALFLGTVSLFLRRWSPFGLAIGQYWARSNLFLLRWVVGIRTEVEGGENIPAGGCIIASKHQSDWDIFAILPFTGKPAFIAKKELMDIPFFGWAARTLETIPIDRKKGGGAIAAMTEDARGAVARGCRIIIFPEGTRTAPLSDPNYKFGTARLYEALDVPLVPVAVNSGLFWGRNSLVLWPGVARARILEPIPPGLGAVEAQKRMIAAIEAEAARLVLRAEQDGITRPLSSDQRQRLDLLKQPSKA